MQINIYINIHNFLFISTIINAYVSIFISISMSISLYIYIDIDIDIDIYIEREEYVGEL